MKKFRFNFFVDLISFWADVVNFCFFLINPIYFKNDLMSLSVGNITWPAIDVCLLLQISPVVYEQTEDRRHGCLRFSIPSSLVEQVLLVALGVLGVWGGWGALGRLPPLLHPIQPRRTGLISVFGSLGSLGSLGKAASASPFHPAL